MSAVRAIGAVAIIAIEAVVQGSIDRQCLLEQNGSLGGQGTCIADLARSAPQPKAGFGQGHGIRRAILHVHGTTALLTGWWQWCWGGGDDDGAAEDHLDDFTQGPLQSLLMQVV